MADHKDDDYTFYRNALRGEVQEIQENNPQCGFWRRKNQGGWTAIAIWRDENAKVVGTAATGAGSYGGPVYKILTVPIKPEDWWISVAKHPIPEVTYRGFIENYGVWQDGSVGGGGANMPTDPLEALLAELDGKLENAKRLLATDIAKATKIQADTARNLEQALAALNHSADAMHKAEKAPALAESLRIDDKYRFRDAAKLTRSHLKLFYESWQRGEQKRLEIEAKAKYEAERAAAEEARREAEEARKRLEENDPIMAAITPAEELPELPSGPSPVKVAAIGGGYGKKANLTVTYEGRISDYPACVTYYINHPTIWAAAEKLVKAQVKLDKGSTKIPGVDVFDSLGRKIKI